MTEPQEQRYSHVWRMEPLEVRVTTEGQIEIAQEYPQVSEAIIEITPAQVKPLVDWLNAAFDEAVKLQD